jgi:hypothetical protein
MEERPLQSYVGDILSACQNDPARLELAAANFQLLINAMKRYDRSPVQFDGAFDESEDLESRRAIVSANIAKIIGAKQITQQVLREIGKVVSARTGLNVDRDTKRKQSRFLDLMWSHWDVIQPTIMDFVREGVIQVREQDKVIVVTP